MLPNRMCMVCRTRKPKGELIRIVKNKSGEISLDKTGKLDGRGAYICKDKACIDKLLKTKALNKSYHINVSQEVYENILNEIK
ncbi:MAG TPA: YlxR family protein [Candidatus Caccopulliclostridium gallistercoris]|uniref:YlxR family protein n=1 Tax=Candidatus Caccopulliclostridium gallistercoris TaxID=2840719 RepID=A0A9D1SYX6_9FIRM|nr:YlxR family protein [Candidatus Caccopulliclostridium gallistercoris]